MAVGRAIRVLRTTKGLRQNELAKLVGCTGNYLSLVERDARTPSMKLLKRIGEAMCVPLEMLLALSVDENAADDPSKKEMIQDLKQVMLLLYRSVE